MSNRSAPAQLPLAEVLRPQNLSDFFGHEVLLKHKLSLKKLLKVDNFPSLIFYGPPGVGKTTLARLIAKESQKQFYELSAVSAGKNQLRAIIAENNRQAESLQCLIHGAPIIFLDEIHRFNTAQQDFLLPFIESGQIILIGATTQNPSFSINQALLSRCQICVFESLDKPSLEKVITKALAYYQQFNKGIKISPAAKVWLLNYSVGDARKLLNHLQQTYLQKQNFTLSSLKAATQYLGNYDRAGEEHYNCISAFIKSMRAGEKQAALYYLARMIKNGEQGEYIARRMIVFASEDIGLAVPTAIVVANQAYEAVRKVGLPEAEICLATATAYLSDCKKSRSAYDDYRHAQSLLKAYPQAEVPLFLRNGANKFCQDLGYGDNYQLYNQAGKSYLPAQIPPNDNKKLPS